MLTNLLVRGPKELSCIRENRNHLRQYPNHYEWTICRNRDMNGAAGMASEVKALINGISTKFNGIVSCIYMNCK